VAHSIATVWANKQVLEVISDRAEKLSIQGGVAGAKFYFENARRFANPDFVPTKEDTLLARRKTVGIVETSFNYEGTYFTLVDVGGQRSERKKWLHCFNQVTSVIFLTAINEYDMVLEEDYTTNRLLESIKLWKALTGSNFFKNTPFILFLNKSDLFEIKIQSVPLKDVFVDFEKVTSTSEYGKYDIMGKSWRYILKQFSAQFEGCSFFPHLTNVLNTELCKKVFSVVQDTIVANTLKVF
jgi:guanine nucleotide-binding protein subunit alpha